MSTRYSGFKMRTLSGAISALTTPTSPCTMIDIGPSPGCYFVTSLTFAAFTIASAA
ncbi:MAG TPA: hypothetical protein VFB02_15395 [Bradyrhizobium sp.]|nr:hypothetical protein [Bradyrhizobium sp.]